MYNYRTDLADERKDIYMKANKLENKIDGIEAEEKAINDINISKVIVKDKNGEQAIGKPIGDYITIDLKKLKILSEEEIEMASEVMANELKPIIDKNIQDGDEILVVGLGNKYVTPDALGPKVIDNIDITRHIIKYLPQYIDENSKSVSAFAPGVLGTTGIETLEIIKGVTENIKPKLTIVIDSLASRSVERINKTIQISDTGIVPGGGVDNKRKEITKNTLGMPVIAIGVPTVVESAVLVSDGIDMFIDKLQEEAKSNDYLNNLKNEDKYEMIREALIPNDYNLIVTPKEIDKVVENMSLLIAKGINRSL